MEVVCSGVLERVVCVDKARLWWLVLVLVLVLVCWIKESRLSGRSKESLWCCS